MSDIEMIERIVKRAVLEAIESHPRPSHVNQITAAEMLEVSPATVSRLVHSGKLKLNDCGKIPISEIDRVLKAA